MRNFGTDATHTARTDSKIAGQAIFLAIASMLKITLITPRPPPPSPPPTRQQLSSQPASTTANVSPSIAPGVNIPMATKVSPTLLRRVPRLRCETAFRWRLTDRQVGRQVGR
ncbi:hypothetical protein E2C01_072744 [Portunus trituberculatus]|uniref:Uncharacterized protein n=1 Tax=Portunus trituberculatus TaxID=210409 RepID=A0A5B7I0V1_PORTR|nr:hypothetical protein [Portunus trituberculatus]